MSFSIATFVVSTTLGTTLAFSQVPPTSMPATLPAASVLSAADVAALVAQLGDGDVARRDAAQRQLLAAGDGVLAALQAARLGASDADVQLRLDTLLVQIQERIDVGASRITLRFTDAPLDEVLASLGEQAHATFNDPSNEFGVGESLPKVTIDVSDVSFWAALGELQRAANVVFIPQPDGWRATRNFGRQTLLRGSESGAFLVQPTMASYQRNISYARDAFGGDGGEHFTLQFQALCEPKIRLASGAGTLELSRVVDSNGNDLLAAQRVQQVNTGNGQNAIVCSVPLKYPKNAGEAIAEVSGTLRISMARRLEAISSDDLLGTGRLESTIEGVKVTVEPQTRAAADDVAQPDGGAPPAPNARVRPRRQGLNAPPAGVANGVSLTITIEGNDNAAFVQRIQQNLQQQVRLTDSRGMAMHLSNFDQTRNDPAGSAFRITYVSPQPQLSRGPYKFKLEIPTSYREVEVPFSMRDLKMP